VLTFGSTEQYLSLPISATWTSLNLDLKWGSEHLRWVGERLAVHLIPMISSVAPRWIWKSSDAGVTWAKSFPEHLQRILASRRSRLTNKCLWFTLTPTEMAYIIPDIAGVTWAKYQKAHHRRIESHRKQGFCMYTPIWAICNKAWWPPGLFSATSMWLVSIRAIPTIC